MANKKKHFKYILDLVMTIIIVALMKTIFTGLLLHEILGLFVFVLIIVHLILNLKYILGLFKNFFNNKVKLSSKIGIIIDIILALVVIIIVLTGIIISKEIFGFNFSVDLINSASRVHLSSSYIALILISIHIGLHWSSIMNAFKKIFNLKTFSKIRTYVLRFITFLIVLAGIRGSFNQNIYTKITTGTSSEDNDEIESTLSYISKKKDNALASSQTEGSDVQSLEDYLSNLHCTGCGKHCPLSAPKCNVGVEQAEKATAEYEASISATNTEESNTPSSLEEYLSSLNCNLCPKHCPLSNPGCGKGEELAAAATSEYYASINVEDNTKLENNSTDEDTSDDNSIREMLTDYIPIMGLYIAGTHYLVMLPRYMNKKK